MAYQCIELDNIPCCVKSQSGFSNGSIWYSDLSVNNNIYNDIPVTSGFEKIYECGDIGIYLNKYDRGNNYWDISIYGRDETNNVNFNQISFAISKSAYGSLGIFVVIDDDAELGEITFGYAYNNYSDPSRYDITGFSPNNAKYQSIKNAIVPPIVYNWQSVPSISGKNGILSLVTLDSESINDGEPVSGAAVSVFDQNPVSGNNVKDIVDGNTPLIPSAVDVTAAFIISNPPVGELASRILAAKKDSIPESIEDADKTVSIPANASNVTMPGLDENSQYYFAIFVADASGDTAVSDPKDIYTSADEGWSFDYTGEIQTFTAPKTGIYQLETWGAQGGDATDGTNSARGGYGAYAVGEVLLNQGDTIYINVGGQNGYGGGGNWQTEEEEMIYSTNEQIVGTYLDETLYQCTFNISSVSGTSSRTYINLVDLSSYNIKRIVSFEGSWSDGTMYKPFTWADTSSIIGDITYNINSKYLQLLNSGFDQASFYDVSITIRYTKNS